MKPGQHVDGVSLLPVLKGGILPQRPLFWHYPHYSNQGGGPAGAVRLGDFKLIEWYEDDKVELYNLKDDIGEKTNLALKEPEKLKRLITAWEAWDSTLKEPEWVPNRKPGKNANTSTQSKKKKANAK